MPHVHEQNDYVDPFSAEQSCNAARGKSRFAEYEFDRVGVIGLNAVGRDDELEAVLLQIRAQSAVHGTR